MENIVKAKRGAPEKYSREKMEALVELARTSGRTHKALAAERHIPYVSYISALRRFDLSPRAGKVKAVAVEVEPLAA